MVKMGMVLSMARGAHRGTRLKRKSLQVEKEGLQYVEKIEVSQVEKHGALWAFDGMQNKVE